MLLKCGASTLFAAGATLAGVLVLVAALALPGIAIGDSLCSGGGEQQVCTYDRHVLSLGRDFGAYSTGFVLAGATLISFGAIALLGFARPVLACLALVASVLGLVHTSNVGHEFCVPVLGEGAGCVTRPADLGTFLEPKARELGAVAARRHEVRTGARADSHLFRARSLAGWSVLRGIAVVLLAWSAFELAPRVVRPRWLAGLVAGTFALWVWALVEEGTSQCYEGASECYEGLLVLFVTVLTVAVWGAVGIAAVIVRGLRRRQPRA